MPGSDGISRHTAIYIDPYMATSYMHAEEEDDHRKSWIDFKTIYILKVLLFIFTELIKEIDLIN